MVSLPSLMSLTHLVGLALGLGAATVKLALLPKSSGDCTFIPACLKAIKPVTRLIVLGMILLTASGVGWLLPGYAITKMRAAKLVLAIALWLSGLLIDNGVEPRFRTLAPAVGETALPAFLRA